MSVVAGLLLLGSVTQALADPCYDAMMKMKQATEVLDSCEASSHRSECIYVADAQSEAVLAEIRMACSDQQRTTLH
jgi:hypothetical protein